MLRAAREAKRSAMIATKRRTQRYGVLLVPSRASRSLLFTESGRHHTYRTHAHERWVLPLSLQATTSAAALRFSVAHGQLWRP